MGVDWRNVLEQNKQPIIKAAQAVGGTEIVCVLLNLDEAGGRSVGEMTLIADSELKGAVPINDPAGASRLACLPVTKEYLVRTLAPVEDVEPLRAKMRFAGSIAMWALVMEGNRRTTYELHAPSVEDN